MLILTSDFSFLYYLSLAGCCVLGYIVKNAYSKVFKNKAFPIKTNLYRGIVVLVFFTFVISCLDMYIIDQIGIDEDYGVKLISLLEFVFGYWGEDILFNISELPSLSVILHKVITMATGKEYDPEQNPLKNNEDPNLEKHTELLHRITEMIRKIEEDIFGKYMESRDEKDLYQGFFEILTEVKDIEIRYEQIKDTERSKTIIESFEQMERLFEELYHRKEEYLNRSKEVTHTQ